MTCISFSEVGSGGGGRGGGGTENLISSSLDHGNCGNHSGSLLQLLQYLLPI